MPVRTQAPVRSSTAESHACYNRSHISIGVRRKRLFHRRIRDHPTVRRRSREHMVPDRANHTTELPCAFHELLLPPKALKRHHMMPISVEKTSFLLLLLVAVILYVPEHRLTAATLLNFTHNNTRMVLLADLSMRHLGRIGCMKSISVAK